jgi:hypothetical protein
MAKLGRLQDRNIARLRAAQNLVDQVAGAAVQVEDARPVGDEGPRFDVDLRGLRLSRAGCTIAYGGGDSATYELGRRTQLG